MNLKEASNEIEKIDNEIEYWLNEKEIVIGKVLPGALDTSKENVTGGTRTDKFLNYIMKNEKIDYELDKLYARKNNLESYVENELHRLGKYKEVEKLIIYYKEQCLENYTWEEIGKKVYMSKDNCRKIYRKWKKQRNID